MKLNGSKIRELRLKAGLSQFGLSLEVDENRELLSKIENGRRAHIRLETAYKLAQYFGVKIDDLI